MPKITRKPCPCTECKCDCEVPLARSEPCGFCMAGAHYSEIEKVA